MLVTVPTSALVSTRAAALYRLAGKRLSDIAFELTDRP